MPQKEKINCRNKSTCTYMYNSVCISTGNVN